MSYHIYNRPSYGSISNQTIDVSWFENGFQIGVLPKNRNQFLYRNERVIFYINESALALFIAELIKDYEIDFLFKSYSKGNNYSAFTISETLKSIKEINETSKKEINETKKQKKNTKREEENEEEIF